MANIYDRNWGNVHCGSDIQLRKTNSSNPVIGGATARAHMATCRARSLNLLTQSPGQSITLKRNPGIRKS